MRFFLICFFALLTSTILGQNDDIPQTEEVNSPIEISQSGQKTKKEYNGPLSMFAGNPGKAALYSLILPGAGQFYNKKYLKVPIVMGIEGAVIGLLVRNNNQYRRWDREANQKLNGTNPNPCTFSQAELESFRDRARRQRDITLISTILVHLFQVADAFIHRHLIEFDVDDDLGFEWHAPQNGIGLGITFTF